MAAPRGNQNAKGHGEGRPQEYTSEWIDSEAKLFLEWMKKPDSLYFKAFAIERGYAPQRLTEFADKNVNFAEALSQAKGWQESRLVLLGCYKKIDSSMAKFVLTNCHSWAEKNQLSGDVVNPLSFILREIDGKSQH